MRYHAPVPGNIPSHLRQRGITASVRLKPSPHPFRPSGGRMRHCLGQSEVGPPLSRVSGRDGVLPQCGLAGGHRQRVEELQAGLVDGRCAGDGDAGLVPAVRTLALEKDPLLPKRAEVEYVCTCTTLFVYVPLLSFASQDILQENI